MAVDTLELLASCQPHLALKRFLLGPFLLFVQVLSRLFLLPGHEILPHVLLDLSQRLVLDGQGSLSRVLHRRPSPAGGRASRGLPLALEAGLDLELLGKVLDCKYGVDAHHHLLLGETVLEKLLDRHAGFDAQQVGADEESPLHEFVVVHVHGVRVDLA